jgi:plastocyanin
MRRTLAISSLLGGSILTVALFFSQAAQAQSWQATVGAQSKDMGLQAMAFLPNEIWIHEGDSITWEVDSDEVHTVTFLIPAKPGQPGPPPVPPTLPQIRPPFQVGCPGFSTAPTSFDGSKCVTTSTLANGQTFTVTFPKAGNFKLVCLVHAYMTGTVHVLDRSLPLPHNQDFYDDEAEKERRDLLSDRDQEGDHDRGNSGSQHSHSHWNEVTSGTGEIVATPGGAQNLAVMRFTEPTKVIHAGETVEWTNADPTTRHTITFGTEPADFRPPSANVKVEEDGTLSATINSPSDSVNSGIIVASLPERTGVAQAAVGVTRFRVQFTHAGVFPYICAIHDNLGMKGEVVVLP